MKEMNETFNERYICAWCRSNTFMESLTSINNWRTKFPDKNLTPPVNLKLHVLNIAEILKCGKNTKYRNFFMFVEHQCFLWKNWHLCFGLQMTSALGIRNRVHDSHFSRLQNSLTFPWLENAFPFSRLSSPSRNPEDGSPHTHWPLDGKHGSWVALTHLLFQAVSDPQESGHAYVDEWFPKSTYPHSFYHLCQQVLSKALIWIASSSMSSFLLFFDLS